MPAPVALGNVGYPEMIYVVIPASSRVGRYAWGGFAVPGFIASGLR